MTTLSSNGVIKPGMGLQAEKFSFPVQIPSLSPKTAKGEGARKENPAGDLKKKPGGAPEQRLFQDTGGMMDDAREEAEKILRRANEQAERILDEAKKTAEQMQDEAVLRGQGEGYAKGYEEGCREGQQKMEQILREQQETFRSSMEQAIRAVDTAKERSLGKYLDELKECALAVAEKVICISLKSSGQIIKRMLIAETEKLKKTAWVKIYMEKNDYNMMMEADADVVNELARLSDNIKFVVMNKEKPGNCIIEMPEEIVDISVDTQMENIRELLENIKV